MFTNWRTNAAQWPHRHPERTREESRAQRCAYFSPEILRGLSLRMTVFTIYLSVCAMKVHANPLVFCCHARNDLYALLQSKGETCERYDDPLRALEHTPADGALLVLGEEYPEQKVSLPVTF